MRGTLLWRARADRVRRRAPDRRRSRLSPSREPTSASKSVRVERPDHREGPRGRPPARGPPRAPLHESRASTRARTSSTERTSPWSSRPAPIRLIRAPESSQASSVSARRFPLAIASSRSVMPSAPSDAELGGDDVEHLAHVLGCGPDADAHRAGVVVGHPLRPHRVGQPTTLPDLLEEPAREPPAEDVVEDGQRVAPRVRAVDRARGRGPGGPVRWPAGSTRSGSTRSPGGSGRGGAAAGAPANRASSPSATARWSRSPATATTMLPGR